MLPSITEETVSQETLASNIFKVSPITLNYSRSQMDRFTDPKPSTAKIFDGEMVAIVRPRPMQSGPKRL
jgi:hypothetical protein